MAKTYILEHEVEKAYNTAKANDYFLNGKQGKASKIEETVRNGTVVITAKQTRTLLNLLESLPPKDAHKKISAELGIESGDYSKVMRTLERNKLVIYRKTDDKYILTRKGRILRNGRRKDDCTKKGNKK